jgi:hypothetical protein
MYEHGAIMVTKTEEGIHPTLYLCSDEEEEICEISLVMAEA